MDSSQPIAHIADTIRRNGYTIANLEFSIARAVARGVYWYNAACAIKYDQDEHQIRIVKIDEDTLSEITLFQLPLAQIPYTAFQAQILSCAFVVAMSDFRQHFIIYNPAGGPNPDDQLYIDHRESPHAIVTSFEIFFVMSLFRDRKNIMTPIYAAEDYISSQIPR